MPRKQNDMKAEKDKRPAPQPVDVHDGIPDRVASPSWRRLAIAAAVFGIWTLFLIYCLLAGR